MMVGHVVPIQLVSKTQSEIDPYLSAWAMHAQDSDPPDNSRVRLVGPVKREDR